ncbi:MAG: site-2 protease family protein [Phycisphaerales bacterium]|nr:site-2 protease family protein [Phycisphaerales bacterium]
MDRKRMFDDDRNGGLASRLRRIFGGADDPMRWSLPLFRITGILVRIHVIFIVFIVARLIASVAQSSSMGIGSAAMGAGALFVVVLLHELGHCHACRATGGEADEILMWPLGGLAWCAPPNRAMAHLITAVGGPAVNVVICLLLTPILLVLTHSWSLSIANPLSLGDSLWALHKTEPAWWVILLWWLNAVSLILLLFNLLPMFPLDGGRIVQTALWKRIGYARSMRIAVTTGFAAAIVLGIAALVVNNILVFAIALFGGVVCWLEKRRLQFADQEMGFAGYDFSQGYTSLNAEHEQDDTERCPSTREQRRAGREQQEAEAIDQILAKVSTGGLDSLTTSERRLLKRATKRRQDG